MVTEARIGQLIKMVKDKGSMTVQELVDYFHVSDMTIRRDLQKLEQTGDFIRFHGGIRYIDAPVEMREGFQVSEKQRIAKYCLSLIEPHDTILLDSGTTAYQIAEALAESQIRDVTVITNSLNSAYRLKDVDHIHLLLVGGELRRSSQAFVGTKSRDFFENLYVNKAFISPGGITAKGYTTTAFSDAEVKQCMIQASEITYIIGDSSKFGIRLLNQFAPLETANMIITDSNISEEWIQTIEKAGVRLVMV
jgi:DeoR/GlpR family transcriptional regulator of sugar metabolism